LFSTDELISFSFYIFYTQFLANHTHDATHTYMIERMQNPPTMSVLIDTFTKDRLLSSDDDTDRVLIGFILKEPLRFYVLSSILDSKDLPSEVVPCGLSRIGAFSSSRERERSLWIQRMIDDDRLIARFQGKELDIVLDKPLPNLLRFRCPLSLSVRSLDDVDLEKKVFELSKFISQDRSVCFALSSGEVDDDEWLWLGGTKKKDESVEEWLRSSASRLRTTVVTKTKKNKKNKKQKTRTTLRQCQLDQFISMSSINTLNVLVDYADDDDETLSFRFDGTRVRTQQNLRFDLSIVSYANPTDLAIDFIKRTRIAISNQLLHQYSLLLEEEEEEEGRVSSVVRSYHFTPPLRAPTTIATTTTTHYYPYPLTISYTSCDNDDSRGRNKKIREMLHHIFEIPTFAPYLKPRRTLLSLSHERRRKILGVSDNPLVNVHVGITHPSSCVLVRGSYEYHHYMQGNFDDSGWGCAYRSLQTIVSWFKLNHFNQDINVPSHLEIQQVLVDLKDKPEPFVGSKQWIGSTEIGYVVEHLLGVTAKIVFLSSGKDMPSATHQLCEHFRIEGTPVMIGGGALAFTLLGVAHDENTGSTKWLILDPHYSGCDDLSNIQTKSYMLEGYRAIPCSWRGLDAFSGRSSYNLYLPQRPRGV